jgi:Na+/phosphate symporter
MKDQRIVVNPFRMISPKLDSEAARVQDLHELPVSESHAPEEAVLIMMSKLIEINRILSKCVTAVSPDLDETCARLANEVREQEGYATSSLLDTSSSFAPSSSGHNLFKLVVRFPARLERISDIFGNIMNCFKIKAREGIPFSEKACGELDQIFTLLRDIMVNTRDSLIIRNKPLLEHISAQHAEFREMLLAARFAHWERLEAGFCARQASSLYLDILDSFTAISEYLHKLANSLIALEEVPETQG